MGNNYQHGAKASFLKRFAIPSGAALLGWLVLHFISGHLGWIENRAIYKAAMNVVHLVLFFYLLFNGFFVYRAMFLRGAGLSERIAGCYLTPIAYAIKEIIRVSEFFTIGESFFYCLLTYPVLGLFVWQAGLLAVSEMLCRKYYKKRNLYEGKAVTAAPLAILILSIITIYFLFLYDDGGTAFYIYMEIYKLLPRTNCKACGEISCFVFANKLVAAQVRLQDCPVLNEAQYTKQQAQLVDLLGSEMPAIGRREV